MPTVRRAGFTLIELLVVISIVLLLSMLGMTAARQVLQSARKSSSGNNLKAIGMAVTGWAGEHEGRYPFLVSNTDAGEYVGTTWQPAYWCDLIAPDLAGTRTIRAYNGSTCTRSASLIDPLVADGQHHHLADYGGNTFVFRYPWVTPAPLTVAAVPMPTQLVLAMTAGATPRATWYLDADTYVDAYDSRVNDISDRGTGSVMTVFADGHVEAIPPARFVAERARLLKNR